MVDVSVDKARAARNKAFLTNIRYMQEKVIAMKAEENYKEETNTNAPVNQENKTRDERS